MALAAWCQNAPTMAMTPGDHSKRLLRVRIVPVITAPVTVAVAVAVAVILTLPTPWSAPA